MEQDLILLGWTLEFPSGEDDPIYPFIVEGDIFAQWILGDKASDFVHLVGLILGEENRHALMQMLDEIAETAIHVHVEQRNRADFFVRLKNEKLFGKIKQFISPELREMIEAAATGEHF